MIYLLCKSTIPLTLRYNSGLRVPRNDCKDYFNLVIPCSSLQGASLGRVISSLNGSAAGPGGAVRVSGGGGLGVEYVVMRNNFATEAGGAVYYKPDTARLGLSISDSHFLNNST